jgi:hypothetical protein
VQQSLGGLVRHKTSTQPTKLLQELTKNTVGALPENCYTVITVAAISKPNLGIKKMEEVFWSLPFPFITNGYDIDIV